MSVWGMKEFQLLGHTDKWCGRLLLGRRAQGKEGFSVEGQAQRLKGRGGRLTGRSLRSCRTDAEKYTKPGTSNKVLTACHLCSASAEMLLETDEPEPPLVDASASDDGSAVPCNRKHQPSAAAKLEKQYLQHADGQTVPLYLTCRQIVSMQTLVL